MREKFSPLVFLASLGAGGLAVAGFAFLNYTVSHGAGLIYVTQILNMRLELFELICYRFAELVMIIFTVIHIILTLYLLRFYIPWLKTAKHKEIKNNPLKNSELVAPILSFTMTLNVFLAVVRYFIPQFAINLQTLMLPGLVMWLILWVILMKIEISLLKISFVKNFDVSKINFGWLLHPFALGMVTVAGMGIAALAHNYTQASIAVFFSLVSGTMGLFLLVVKLVSLFKSHITAPGLPEKEFLPSFLIVIPNITLYAISFFRFGHYLEHQMHFKMGYYFVAIMLLSFTFEVWYIFFGLALLKDYLQKEMHEDFHVTQWGLVCPFVAFAVLATFIYKLFIPSVFFSIFILIIILFTSILFFYLLVKHFISLKKYIRK